MNAAEISLTGLACAVRPWTGAASIENLAPMSGGASREIWAFDAVAADGTRTELVLRRDPPGRPSEPEAIHREARALTLAFSEGLAVPEMLFMSEGPGLGTAGMVMRRVAGETIARRILRDAEYATARGALVGQVAAFAARLHGIEPPTDFPCPDPVADLRATLADLGARSPVTGPPAPLTTSGAVSPVFELALHWLDEHAPPSREPVLLHGDLRLGNLVVGPDELRAVLDWELTHAGNPAEDLGWLCVKAWRFGVAAPVAGLSTRGELLAAYRAAGGVAIDLEELRWWEVLGTLRWGVICMTQAEVHLSGALRSVELAAIGRRVCEQEWDLLLLLAPEAAAQAAAARPRLSGAGLSSPASHGRPTASELVEAVREFLTGQVLPSTGGPLAFHARVAANVLGMVERELEYGPPPPVTDPADAAALAAHVAAKLAVANPRYFDPAPRGR